MTDNTISTEFTPDQYPYRIKNWSKFQHYKKRNPPWVKLHVSLFTSEDWVNSTDHNKLLMIACIMVASKFDGNLPKSTKLVQRMAYIRRKVNYKPLIECGFLIETQANACSLLASARPETETETETEKNIDHPSDDHYDDWPSDYREQFWSLVPKKVGKQGALNALVRVRKSKSVTWNTLMDGVAKYQALARVKERKFIKDPQTWLNKGCWDDEIIPEDLNGGNKSAKEKYSDILQRLGSGSLHQDALGLLSKLDPG